MAAGTYRTAGASADFSSFESLALGARGARLTISGTERDDSFTVRTDGPDPSTVVADLLGGNDDLLLGGVGFGAGSRIELGSGEDRLVAARSTGRLALDLKRDELEVVDDTFPASGVEDAFLMAPRVSLVGDAQDNTLIAYACRATITGGHGNDELIWDPDYVFEEYSYRCPKTTTMRGGPGIDSVYGSRGDDHLFGDGDQDTIRGEGGADRIRGGRGADRVLASGGNDDVRGGRGADRLLGGEGRDLLVGQGGRDRADGGEGRDRCVAERERRCER
jgi:Ca2+-binding RTX toxin-like protein